MFLTLSYDAGRGNVTLYNGLVVATCTADEPERDVIHETSELPACSTSRETRLQFAPILDNGTHVGTRIAPSRVHRLPPPVGRYHHGITPT